MKLFLDLDGVLIDWIKGAHELHGLPWENGMWPYTYGPEGWNWNREISITEKDLFEPMGFDFWANLEWMNDGGQILSICEQFCGKENVCLLSSPCHTPGTVEGRLKWIKTNLPEYRGRILIGDCKEFIANPFAVLVDDCDRNIFKWTENGGIPMLLPRPWNSLFLLDTIITLKESLCRIKG